MIAVKLIPIGLKELKPLIHFAYEGDDDLISKYQADTTRTFQECVDFNYNEILEMSFNKVFENDIHPYRISLQSGDDIYDMGYCVVLTNEQRPQMLLSFAFNMEYRKKVFLKEWLRQVEGLLGLPYYTALWDKNTRAIDFYKKNGFEQIKGTQEGFSFWVKGYELLSQYKNSRLYQLMVSDKNDQQWQSVSPHSQSAQV